MRHTEQRRKEIRTAHYEPEVNPAWYSGQMPWWAVGRHVVEEEIHV